MVAAHERARMWTRCGVLKRWSAGYCFVEDAISGDALKAVQAAYERHAPATREAWLAALRSGKRTADVGTYGNTTSTMVVDMGPGIGAGGRRNPAPKRPIGPVVRARVASGGW